MATVKPFKILRPKDFFADKIASLPYDVMSSDEARDMAADNPFSFLHVDKSEIDLDPLVNIYDECVYQKASENLKAMITNDLFCRESKPVYAIYELAMDGRVQTGLVGVLSVDEYENGIIKKHEHTRADKELDRTKHVDACAAQTGPIFIAYREDNNISELISQWKSAHTPVYDFLPNDGVAQRVWIIDDQMTAEKLEAAFESISNLYIADGHHRSASAVNVAKKYRAEKGSGNHDYFMSVLFPSSQLYIMDYNRVIKDLAGNAPNEFLDKISDAGFIIGREVDAFKPKKPKEFGLYLAGNWYSLHAKSRLFVGKNPVDSLDVSILADNILTPIARIGDMRIDKRIEFIGGIRGLSTLERLVDSGEFAAAFSMYPTTMNELMNVADMGLIMPPKSTWFEPKLRSGLFIHEI